MFRPARLVRICQTQSFVGVLQQQHQPSYSKKAKALGYRKSSGYRKEKSPHHPPKSKDLQVNQKSADVQNAFTWIVAMHMNDPNNGPDFKTIFADQWLGCQVRAKGKMLHSSYICSQFKTWSERVDNFPSEIRKIDSESRWKQLEKVQDEWNQAINEIPLMRFEESKDYIYLLQRFEEIMNESKRS